MMQVLLQKISRKSKTIKKQEKIVNDNLKRKRIHLEREKFDIMSVLRQSMHDIIEDPQHSSETKRPSRKHNSPALSGNASSKEAKVQAPLYSNTLQQIGEDEGSIGCDPKRKQSTIYDPNNSLSTQALDTQRGRRDNVEGAQDDSRASNQIKTPDPPSCKINSHEQLKERQVQQAFNLSEIDETFHGNCKATRNGSDFAANGIPSQYGYTRPVEDCRMTVNYNNDVHFQDSKTNENLKIISPQRIGQLIPKDQGSLFDLEQDQTRMCKFSMTEHVHPFYGHHENAKYHDRKLQSTQVMRNKKKTVNMAQDVIIIPTQPNFSERLANGQGNFAIADLQKESETPNEGVVKICVRDPSFNNVGRQFQCQNRREREDSILQASDLSEKAQKSTKSRKCRKNLLKNKSKANEKVIDDANLISNQISEVANDTARELSPLHSYHQFDEEALQNNQVPVNHQLAVFHSQSLPARIHNHIPDIEQFFQNNDIDLQNQQSLIPVNENMQISQNNQLANPFMIEQNVSGQSELATKKQPSPVVANNMAHQGTQQTMFELQLHRSQSLIVPPVSYLNHRQPIGEEYPVNLALQNHSGSNGQQQINSNHDNRTAVDNIFDDVQIDFAMEQPNSMFYQINSKDVANPYEAAKRRLYNSSQKVLQQQNSNQGKQGSQESKNLEETQMQTNNEGQNQFIQGQSMLLEVSPMPNQINQTPQSKQMQQEGVGSMIASQFMGGVMVDTNQHSQSAHRLQQSDQQQDQNLLSGGRLSIGNNTSHNPFLFSAGIDSMAGVKNIEQSGHLQVPADASNTKNFLNTPGNMLNGGQQATEKHRESVNVDAWNVSDQHTMNVLDYNQTQVHPQVVVNEIDEFNGEQIYQQYHYM